MVNCWGAQRVKKQIPEVAGDLTLSGATLGSNSLIFFFIFTGVELTMAREHLQFTVVRLIVYISYKTKNHMERILLSWLFVCVCVPGSSKTF